jgi:DNA-binding MarR family transcriptional regulator
MENKKAMQEEGNFYLCHEIRVLIFIISKLNHSDIEKRLKSEKVDISPLGFGVIKILNKKSQTLVQLSKMMMIAPPTLMPIIDSLEKKGYLIRGANPKDRRMNPLEVTGKSKRIISKMRLAKGNDSFSKSITKLGKMRASLLVKLLEEVVESMSSKKKKEEILFRCHEYKKIHSKKSR